MLRRWPAMAAACGSRCSGVAAGPSSTMTLTRPSTAARSMTCRGVGSPAPAMAGTTATTETHVARSATAMVRIRMKERASGTAPGPGDYPAWADHRCSALDQDGVEYEPPPPLVVAAPVVHNRGRMSRDRAIPGKQAHSRTLDLENARVSAQECRPGGIGLLATLGCLALVRRSAPLPGRWEERSGNPRRNSALAPCRSRLLRRHGRLHAPAPAPPLTAERSRR